MMEKVCYCPGVDERGDPLTYLLTPGRMIKTASAVHPLISQFAENVPRDDGQLHVLLNAMGAAEYYGQNINNDLFDEYNRWADVDEPVIKRAHLCLPNSGPQWGYKTFEHYAHAFAHHANKDPEKGFGHVKLAVWNDPMKRVELVVCIDREKAAMVGAQDVVDQLDRGEHPDWSMGAKVPWDRCTCHGDCPETYDRMRRALRDYPNMEPGKAIKLAHKQSPIPGIALTRNEYCGLMKTAAGSVRPDGVQVGVHNDFPRFFDISRVYIGADRIAKTISPDLTKVANGDMMAWLRDNPVEEHLKRNPHCGCQKCQRYRARKAGKPAPKKKAGFHKTAAVYTREALRARGPTAAQLEDRLRRVLGNPPYDKEKRADQEKQLPLQQKGLIERMSRIRSGLKKFDSREPDLPTKTLDNMGGSIPKALGTSSMMGIVLKPHEFQRIILIGIGKRPLADDLDRAGNVFSQQGAGCDKSLPVDPFDTSPSLIKSLLGHMGDRSGYAPCLCCRISKTMARSAGRDRAEIKHPLLDKLASAYAGYRENLLAVVPQAASCATNEPVVAQALLQHDLLDDFGGMAKTAISSKALDTALIAGVLPLTYFLAGHVRKKRERGEDLGMMQKFVDDHPVLTAMLLSGLAHGATSVR